MTAGSSPKVEMERLLPSWQSTTPTIASATRSSTLPMAKSARRSASSVTSQSRARISSSSRRLAIVVACASSLPSVSSRNGRATVSSATMYVCPFLAISPSSSSQQIKIVLNGVGIEDGGTIGLINGALQIWNFFVAISALFAMTCFSLLTISLAAALLVDKIGRRPLFLTSNAGMLVTFGVWTLAAALYQTHKDRSAANAVIAMIPLFYLTYSIGKQIVTISLSRS